MRVDSNSIDPPNSPAGKKAPAGLFQMRGLRSPPAPIKNRRRRDTLAVFCLQRMAWLLSGAGRMPSHWSGWVSSRHCPEVERGISIFTVFEEPFFDFGKQHKK